MKILQWLRGICPRKNGKLPKSIKANIDGKEVKIKLVKAKKESYLPKTTSQRRIRGISGIDYSRDFYFIHKGFIRRKCKADAFVEMYQVKSFDEIYPVIEPLGR